ncbi:MAG: tRNA (cytidine(34)-2'-O)-methyltransferase [Deltaproteobacteria bacterium]|nr:tRNA (cytidine(34)-2'-O)-methyltransferase [Deltaproteobacteria bacterium]
MQIVLFEPEIPPNTGNVARLCAAFGLPLHLIEPLGFKLENRYFRRAGLDYWPQVELLVWPSFSTYLEQGRRGHRLLMSSSRQGEPVQHFRFSELDALVLGPETRGLPRDMLQTADACLRLPIRGGVRSLNLSSAAAILAYQAMLGSGLLERLHEKIEGGPGIPGEFSCQKLNLRA